MEPKNDSELRGLLEEWKAPELSPSVEERVLRAARHGWWHTLLHGSIRIPVPVACGLLALILVGAWRIARPPIPPCSTATVQARSRPVCSPDSSC